MPRSVRDARFTAPVLPPHHVPRPRLVAALEGTDPAPLTLISAGPGAGKTVLLGEWASQTGDRAAWMHLSPIDVQPSRFWRLFTASLRVAGVVDAGAGSFAAERVHRVDDAVDVASCLVEQVSYGHGRVTLVLDGAHLITDPDLLASLDSLIDASGGDLRLILSARHDPLLPLHRYRLGGVMREVRVGDLAMTRGEVETLLAAHGVTLPQAPLEALVKRTEGWAAGVRLAALRMQGSDRPADFVSELAVDQGSVGEYLIEEVLAHEPDAVRTMLIQTSFLPEVTGPLASAITGIDSCTDILEELARTNAFVVPLDPTHTAFRYHQLLRDTLEYLLQRQTEPGLSALRRRAAAWYERQGDLPSAVYWAARDTDPTNAVRLLTHGGLAQAFVERYDASLWGLHELGEPTRSPDGSEAGEHTLAGRVIRALAAGGEDARAALREPRTNDHLDPDSMVTSDLIELLLGQKAGDPLRVRSAAEQLLSRDLERCDRLPAGLRPAVMLADAMAAFWLGTWEPAETVFEQAFAEAERAGSLSLQVEILAAMALVDAYLVRARRAEARILRAEALLASESVERPAALSLARALRALQAADVTEGDRYLRETLLRPLLGVDPGLEAMLDFLQAVRLSVVGQEHVALGLLQRPTRHAPPPLLRTYDEILVATIETALGRPRAALEGLRHYPAASALASRDQDAGLGCLVASVRACAHAALGEFREANASIGVLFTTPHPEMGRYQVVDAMVAAALIAYLQHQEGRAVELLVRALEIGGPDVTLPALRKTAAFAPLLARHPTLASQWPVPPPDVDAPATRDPLDAWMPDPLTVRERSVLRLLATNMSTAEIADEMCVSVNTVKTHLAAIYRKLATRKRRETVLRARELELL